MMVISFPHVTIPLNLTRITISFVHSFCAFEEKKKNLNNSEFYATNH